MKMKINSNKDLYAIVGIVELHFSSSLVIASVASGHCYFFVADVVGCSIVFFFVAFSSL